jgi:PAS domain S-box-containing protein
MVFNGIVQDISDRKQVEKTLAENEEQIHLLLDSTAEAIYGLDMNGNCTFCNSSCVRLLGYNHTDELLGKNMHWQIHAKHSDGTPFPIEECRIFQAFQKGEGTHVDDEVLWRSDGTSFSAEYWSYPQRRDGVVVGAVVTFLDITERKHAEEEIMLKNVLLSAQQEASIDGIMAVDGNGKVMLINRRFAEIWNIPPELIASKSDELLLTSVQGLLADPDAFLEKTRYLYDHRRETSRDEILLTDGRVLDRYSAPMFGPDDQYYGRVWYFRDISERKRAEETLREEKDYTQNIIGSMADMLVVVAPDGTIATVNEATCDLLGYPEGELIGQPATVLFQEE